MTSLVNAVILVLDSNPKYVEDARTILSTRQHEILVATEPATALAIGNSREIDLLLCDVQINGIEGFDLVNTIRQLPNRHDVPVMFTCSSQVPDVVSRRHGNSQVFCVRKPYDPVLLLELVEKALWMPHLVRSHIHRPHIPISAFQGSPSPIGFGATNPASSAP